eukprot:TRINITY_DN64787_c0_g1_i1.p1 TRINITY_DN64787_c0_g1~~TRINITY_DN64787_c0_g1_i1.p1  ORF type:complete len:587 (-),score=85.99 TRINITY_DN64787_c0_g1_i1:46-1806(-)
MMQVLMEQDDGGRRADIIGLEQTMESPVHRMSELGSKSFVEPLPRHAAEHAGRPQDKREERSHTGLVKFKRQPKVPDVGGLGWRTKTGHLLKNQSYYTQKSKQNLWDSATHAGVNTWKDWHGPKMKTDAEMMERLDRFDEEEAHWEAKKTFVNTTRVQTLDRFYNRKINRSMLESQSSWAPHHRARREVHSSFETFDSCMGEKPEKELKKVYTEPVLQRDREAIRQISKRIQNEETWKMVFKQMEQERRQDIRADLQMRQAHTDRLMAMSGQPLRQDQSHSALPNNCSSRSEELSQPRLPQIPSDVTKLTDFRGLIHADCEHALESLYPGFGHELSVGFRAEATRSMQPGWPPPPAAQTPRAQGKETREQQIKKGATVIKGSIPASSQRLSQVATRTNEDTFIRHSKAQFLKTVAPPPPRQSATVLHEDFSPNTTLTDPFRLTGDFMRTEHSIHPTSPSHKAQESLPPPIRSTVYPVVVASHPPSPKFSSPAGHSKASHSQAISPMSVSQSQAMTRNASAPTMMSVASAGSFSRRSARDAPVNEVCRDLDDFEAQASTVPRISNFFATPRSAGLGHSCSQPIVQAK